MPARARLALLVAVACAVAVIAAVGLARTGDDAIAPAGGFAGALRPSGIPAQDFALTDQDGHRATLSAYRGRVVVLTFMYSTCHDTCPLQAQQIRGALDDLGHDVPVLAVSVDPAHDTPARARAFVLRQSMTGRMRFLLGRRTALAPIWRHYGVRPQGDAFEHSASVVLLDRAGRQRIGFPLDQLTPERLAHDVRLLAGERRA